MIRCTHTSRLWFALPSVLPNAVSWTPSKLAFWCRGWILWRSVPGLEDTQTCHPCQAPGHPAVSVVWLSPPARLLSGSTSGLIPIESDWTLPTTWQIIVRLDTAYNVTDYRVRLDTAYNVTDYRVRLDTAYNVTDYRVRLDTAYNVTGYIFRLDTAYNVTGYTVRLDTAFTVTGHMVRVDTAYNVTGHLVGTAASVQKLHCTYLIFKSKVSHHSSAMTWHSTV